MNYFKRIFGVISLTLFAITSFAIGNPPAKVYGVCNCQSKDKKASIIELSLMDDGTFSYVDNTNPLLSVTQNGTYLVKGSKLYLQTADGNKSFHRKWTYNKERTCIKSRYKLNFRRICMNKVC